MQLLPVYPWESLSKSCFRLWKGYTIFYILWQELLFVEITPGNIQSGP